MKKNKQVLAYIIIATSLVIFIAIALVLLMPGGLLAQSIALMEEPVPSIYIQIPPVVNVDDEFKLVVSVRNSGTESAWIEEIRLPQNLLDAVIVNGIFPGTMEQSHYDGYIGFKIGIMLPPSEMWNFEVVMDAKNAADISGFVQVLAGPEPSESGFRLVIDPPKTATPTLTYTPTLTPSLTPIPDTPTPALVTIPYHTVAKITTRVTQRGKLVTYRTGSATILSPDGLLITNAHIVVPTNRIPATEVIVGLTTDPHEAAEDAYLADILLVDDDLNIAILYLTQTIDGTPVNREDLNLPFATLGDSEQLQLGEPINVLGYPEIGGDTITVASGNVSGFTKESQFGDRAYIKTSALIAAGASGGLVVDRTGQMVAVPTLLGDGSSPDLVDCRVIADTNGDGYIDQHDPCIPVGGFINAMRPINLALPLIAEARALLDSGNIPSRTATPTP
jgi:S1-C subfamily serine protease